MIVESGILALCIYGLIKSGDLLKIAATVSFLTFPSLILFAKTGANEILLLLLALEVVPFAFSLLLLKLSKYRNFREMWK